MEEGTQPILLEDLHNRLQNIQSFLVSRIGV